MHFHIILLFLLVALAAFFSASEAALLSTSAVRVRTLLKENRAGATALAKLKHMPRRMIITILIGNNVANITAATIVTLITSREFGSTSLGVAAGLLTLALLIFGEITPKTLASRYSTKLSLIVARPILILNYIFYPLVVFLDWLAQALESVVKFKPHEPITEEEIKTMIEYGVEHNIVSHTEQFIINRALVFADTTARTVMIPLGDSVLLDAAMLVRDALPQIIANGYSRTPVFSERPDNIVGVVLIKTIAKIFMENGGDKPLSAIMADAPFVPDGIRIDYLFKIFQKTRKHLAVVHDGDHHAIGIVTLEDLIEELVGEIADESDMGESDKPSPDKA
ncbi:MAG: hemolysin family protein [Patescibacteria group bacterium]